MSGKEFTWIICWICSETDGAQETTQRPYCYGRLQLPEKVCMQRLSTLSKIHLIRGRRAASLRVKSESSNMCGDSEALRVCPAVLKVQGKRALVGKATAGGLFRHAARGCFLLETSPGDLKVGAAGKACQSALPWPAGIPPS